MLLSWCDSRLSQRRAAFQALRKGALLFYYMVPGADGGAARSGTRSATPGPLGKNPRRAAEGASTRSAVDRDTTLECDVCVVGSGAGGGTAAGVLAAAGLDVVVLESGDYYDDEDFDGGELEGYGRMYMYGGRRRDARPERRPAGGQLPGRRHDHQLHDLVPARPTTCARNGPRTACPRSQRDEYGRSLDAVCERLGVNQEHNAPSAREEVLQRGLTELGWHADFMPRNVRGCEQGANCGYCNYGCRLRRQAVHRQDMAGRRGRRRRANPGQDPRRAR